MSTSAIEKRSYPKFYLLLSLFCALFSVIYEHFSFGVTSYAMVFMAAAPLGLGFLPSLLFRKYLGAEPDRFYNDGVVLITLGMCVQGVLEIYGTSSPWTLSLYGAGGVCLILGIYRTWKSAQ